MQKTPKSLGERGAATAGSGRAARPERLKRIAETTLTQAPQYRYRRRGHAPTDADDATGRSRSQPEKPVKPATEGVETRFAQGGKPIRAEVYLRYIEQKNR